MERGLHVSHSGVRNFPPRTRIIFIDLIFFFTLRVHLPPVGPVTRPVSLWVKWPAQPVGRRGRREKGRKKRCRGPLITSVLSPPLAGQRPVATRRAVVVWTTCGDRQGKHAWDGRMGRRHVEEGELGTTGEFLDQSDSRRLKWMLTVGWSPRRGGAHAWRL